MNEDEQLTLLMRVLREFYERSSFDIVNPISGETPRHFYYVHRSHHQNSTKKVKKGRKRQYVMVIYVKGGEKMETCLESLWELLRTPISELVAEQKFQSEETKKEVLPHKYDLALNSKNIIKAYFDELQDCIGGQKETIAIPEHLSIFRSTLDQFYEKSIEGVIEGAKKAKEISGQCKLCAVCMQCSQNFYDGIINKKLEERKLPFELENYFVMPAQMYYYQQGMESAQNSTRLMDKLLCLKGFSSSTPTIYSGVFDSECVGGGLYLNYSGIGIVIDPGLGFVNSMHKQGIYINNIDVVIITHDHVDHNADAKVISSLLHDLNNYNQRKGKIVKEIFELKTPEEHEITWIIDNSSKNMLKNSVKNIKSLGEYVGKKRQLISGNPDIKLSALRTKHIKGSDESYGIRLFFKYGEIISIGYTSDTAYFPELSNFFAKSDILVFNVSDIYKKDVKGIQDKHSHLGYNGSVKLLKAAVPKLAVASEFCCTNGDFRMGFINTLSAEIAKDCGIDIIPGELGLEISMPKWDIKCSICRKFVDRDHCKVLVPEKEYGKIRYVCGHCVADVLQ